MKCPLCRQTKGRRRCQIQGGDFICASCCGEVRHEGCEGCVYLVSSQHHARDRGPRRYAVVEVIPEVEERCDQALALLERGDLAAGRRIMEHLARSHPDYHMVSYGLGVCHALSERTEEAIACFRAAIAAFPFFVEAHVNLATACRRAFNVPGTVEALQKVVELDGPGGELGRDASQQLAELDATTRENYGLSLSAYLSNHRLFDRAFAALEAGEAARAIDLFQRVLKADPKHVQSHGNLGLAYAQLGNRQKALEYFDAALTLDPTYGPAIQNRAVVASMTDGEKLPPIGSVVEYYSDRVRADKRAERKGLLAKGSKTLERVREHVQALTRR